MQTIVKSLRLHFQYTEDVIGSDDYGYSKMYHETRHYSVTVTSSFGAKFLYGEAMRYYHRRVGRLVRVETVFEYSVEHTGIHTTKNDLPEFLDTDELVF